MGKLDSLILKVLEVLEFGSVWIRTNDQSGKLLERVFTLSGRKLLERDLVPTGSSGRKNTNR